MEGHGMESVVDLRSDTVTRPSEGMRRAMNEAPLGDDVFDDDPTVHEIQKYAAKVTGKEAALFVPTGTMANQLALRAHTVHGDEVIGHKGCHILNYESGAPAALAGVQMWVVDSVDGSLPLEEVKPLVHQTDDPHFAVTRLICMENTNNSCGGTVLPEQNVKEVQEFARSRKISLHLDGARVFNAAIASGSSVGELCEGFDTVSFCLSKGLGAPVGSLLTGSSSLIKKAYRFRKMYGGGMRQAGILAGAGLYALRNNVERLAEDHHRAKKIATALSEMEGITINLPRVQTNLVYFDLESDHPLAACDPEGKSRFVSRLEEEGILITGGPYRLRMVTHLDLDDTDVDRVLASVDAVLKQA